MIREIAAASKEVDYLAFFIDTLMNDFMDHLKVYKVAYGIESVGGASGRSASERNKAVAKEFFKNENGEDPWRAVCCDREARIGIVI